MSDNVESYVHLGCRINIKYDSDPLNPRTEYDNVGTMVCWHRRGRYGDEQPKEDSGEYLMDLATRVSINLQELVDFTQNHETLKASTLTWAENALNHEPAFFEKLKAGMGQPIHVALGALRSYVLNKHYHILPIWAYEHGGIALSTGERTYPFNDVWDSGQLGFIWCTKAKAKQEWGDDEAACLTSLKGEVETYNQYLNGQVYGYVVKRKGGLLDACWGFFGDTDYVKKEAEGVAAGYSKERTEAQFYERGGINLETRTWARPSKKACEKMFHVMQQVLEG